MENFEVGDTVKVVRMDIEDDGYTGIRSQKLCLGGKGKVLAVNERTGVMAIDFNNCTCSINPKWVELVERGRKPYHGKVVCVEIGGFGSTLFKIGKVYQVVNGKLYDESKVPWHSIVYNIEDINRMVNTPCDLGVRFIEFKGYADTGKEKNE